MYILNLTMFILTPFYLFYNLDHSYFTFYLDCILLLPYIYTHWPLRSHFRNASEVQTEHQNGKKGDLSDFERGMVVGARRSGMSFSENC